MIERQIHLSSGGGAALQGYDGLLRFGYTWATRPPTSPAITRW